MEYVGGDENEVDFMEDVALTYIEWNGAKVLDKTDTTITLDNSEFADCPSIITVTIER